MRDYILFLDTEGSGWPRKWDAPYSEKNNWPFCVQIAWVICTKEGEEIKRENHYISDDDFKITTASYKVHGITREYLVAHGAPRQKVMMLLADDLVQYEPLLVGHFMELDMHMIGAEFYRSGIADFSASLPSFCTMKGSTRYAMDPAVKYLRLSDLYYIFFGEEQPGQHNALGDAIAAKECFFEMLNRGDVNDEIIELAAAASPVKGTKAAIRSFIIFCFVLLIIGLFLWIYR